MITQERYKKIPGSEDYYFSIRSEKIHEDISFVLDNKIQNIKLNDTYEFFEKSLSILKMIDIKKLYIHPHGSNEFSYEDISCFKNLEYLVIQNKRPDRIDLSSNLNLKYVLVANCSKIHGLCFLKSLESLVMTKPTQEHFSIETIMQLKNLRTLSLYDAPEIHDLSFLYNSLIERLVIYNAKSVDFSGVELCRLNYLRVEKCKRTENVESIFSLTSLIELQIIDSFNLNSVNDLNSLVNLDVLVVMGKSVFQDGDLSPLKGRLRHFGFDNKKHYSVKYEKFKDDYLRKI